MKKLISVTLVFSLALTLLLGILPAARCPGRRNCSR